MTPSLCWTWFSAALCLLNHIDLVWGLCTDQNVHILGGAYTLSNHLEVGSVLTYQCQEGFYPHPSPQRVCKYNGMWHPAPRGSRCRSVECPDPAVIENADVLPSKERYFYRDQITYQCHDGYELHGPTHRTCLSTGKWSGPHPVCRQHLPPSGPGHRCPDPGVPPGSSRMGHCCDRGSTVTYSCHNLKLIGSEERVCQSDGLWSGTEPTCYYSHTYDSPEEAGLEFGHGIKQTFATLETETNVAHDGKTIRLTRNGALNMYIALDVSMSINQEQFENAKKAVITLMHKIASFSVTPNYEVLFFSSKAMEVIDILPFFGNNKTSFAELVKDLESFQIRRHDQTGTDLNVVFKTFLAKMTAIKQRQANFKEHQHVIIVFTDGNFNMGGNPTLAVDLIKSLVLMDQPGQREKTLDIFMFGIGSEIDDLLLQRLTFGSGPRHYFRLRNEMELHKTFDSILNEEDVQGLCGLHRNHGQMSSTRDKRMKFPWLVFVDVLTDGRPSQCLGSLVSPRFVLTAAHCFTELMRGVEVEADGRQLAVKTIHKHPQYNLSAHADRGVKEFYDYDVALIELTKDVNTSTSLRPICLPCTEDTNSALRATLTCQQQEQLLINNDERINFLSRRNLGEKSAHLKLGESRINCVLKALEAPGVTTKDLSSVVNDNFFCSGGTFPAVDKVACKGDSGGAVFKNQLNRTIQVALVSWGSKLMDACGHDGLVDSDEHSRDFHFNLFKAVPFLKSILGKTDQNYVPLVFVD